MIILYRSSTFHFDRISLHDAEDTESLNNTQISQELHNNKVSSRSYNDTVNFFIFSICYSATSGNQTTRPASLAVEWIPEGGRRRAGRPMRTWQDTLKEDLETMGVDKSDVRDTASDRARWRQLVARCSTRNGRN